MNLRNKYFLLRHGKNIHQTEKKNVTYCYPDDNPPCALIEEGVEEAKKAGEILKEKNIDLIFASDILRVKQTVEIVAKIMGFDLSKVTYDTRLRDLNWGDFGGKNKSEALAFFKDPLERFEKAPPNGENWNQCLERMVNVLNEIEDNFQGENVLIVSHGDPLWLLEGYVKDLSEEDLASQREREGTLRTGEIREL